MPWLRREVQSRGAAAGGIVKSYPLDRIYEEIAFLGYYLHWGYEELMGMEHRERLRFCREVSRINDQMNQETQGKNIFDVF